MVTLDNSIKIGDRLVVEHFIYRLAMLRKAQLTVVVIPAEIRSWYIYNTAYVLLLEHLAAYGMLKGCAQCISNVSVA